MEMLQGTGDALIFLMQSFDTGKPVRRISEYKGSFEFKGEKYGVSKSKRRRIG